MKLDDIKKLIEEATPGPWLSNGVGGYVAFFAVTNERIANYISAPNSAGLNPSAPDAAFIAAARTLMPKLLKLVQLIKEELDLVLEAQRSDRADEIVRLLAELEQL